MSAPGRAVDRAPRGTARSGRQRGFSLLELVFAVAIVASALLGLQAALSGAVLSASDSINRRAASVLARGKLEEILAGASPAEDSGSFEGHEQIRYTSSVEELAVGVGTGGAPTERVRVVRLEVTFPLDAGEQGRGRIALASALPPEEGPQ